MTDRNTDRNKEIIRLYVEEKKSLSETGKIIGLSVPTVYEILCKNNVPRRPLTETNRKTHIDQNYFDKIDTQDKAYILGLLYADGCVLEKDYEIKISLQEEDKKVLDDIKNCICYTGSLRYRFNPLCLNQWVLDFRSKHIFNTMLRLGCVPRKSLVLKFPTEEQVPSHLMSHFIRGYFDGDGCIHIRTTKSKSCSIHFTGTFEMITGISDVFITAFSFKKKKLFRSVKAQREDKNTFTLTFEGKEEVKKTLDFMYKDANLFLERKHKKYQEFVNTLQSKEIEKLEKQNRKCKTTNCDNKYYQFGFCRKCYTVDFNQRKQVST